MPGVDEGGDTRTSYVEQTSVQGTVSSLVRLCNAYASDIVTQLAH